MPRTKPTATAKSTTSKVDQPSENLVDIKSIQLPKHPQPRRYFSAEKMTQLKASIEEHGILEPLIVRPLKNGKYELVAGERRLRAAKDLNLSQVPVVVREFSDQKAYEVALMENLQRDDLNPIDETEGILYLLCQVLQFSSKVGVVSLLNRAANAQRRDIQLSEEEIRQIELVEQLFLKIGRLNRESFRTNRLPLLNLPEDVLQVLRQGEMEYTKATAIAKLKHEEQRIALMEEAISNNWSLAQIKQRIKELQPEADEISKKPTGKQLQASLSSLSKLKSEAWHDEKKQKILVKLVAELQKILQD